MAEFALPYEKAAMHGDPMPDDLCIYDQAAFQALRSLYHSFRDKVIDRETASVEKRKILKALDDATKLAIFQDNLAFCRSEVNRLTESAKAAVRKDPTPENALQLVRVLDGMAAEERGHGATRLHQGE